MLNRADQIEAYQTMEDEITSLPTAALNNNPYNLDLEDFELNDYI